MLNEKSTFILKLSAILFVIVFVSTLLLALTNYITEDKIAQINEDIENKARMEVLSLAQDFEEIENMEFEGSITNFYVGKANDEIVGYCVKVEPSGYGGPINMIVGVGTDLTVTGVKITSSNETAGLGDKAEKDSFLNQYFGLTSNIEVLKSGTGENSVSAISGATRTSRAVTNGVNQALAAAQKVQGGITN